MLKPALLLLIPEVVRTSLSALRDYMAAKRAEAEAKKLEEERKAKEAAQWTNQK